jgi:hypothetical protein
MILHRFPNHFMLSQYRLSLKQLQEQLSVTLRKNRETDLRSRMV